MAIPNFSRRDALKMTLLGTAAMALPLQSALYGKAASRIAESKLPKPYTVPFWVPPVASPTTINGVDWYEITQSAVVGEILPGIKTELFAYNGTVPGPTIRVPRGRKTVLRQLNRLPGTHPRLGYVPWTSTHLHGMPAEPQYDGYADDRSLPGQWKDYEYPNTCEARTLWYHDHGAHHTAENVYMGLAAQYHVIDDVERALPIPKGRYDVPLTISDVMFAEDGQLMWDDDSHSGVYGDVILVNGRPWPTMQVERRKYRFRILNASLARGYVLSLSDGSPFQVIATDGGLMDRPRTVSRIKIGMAERIEIVVDFARYTSPATVRLVNAGVDNARDYDHTGKIMQFEVSGDATDLSNNEVPATLAPLHPAMAVPASAAKKRRYMRLEKEGEIWAINDETWADVVSSGYTQIFANPQPGDVEIWDIENKSGGWFHPLHIHFVDFKVLERNGRRPRPEEEGPKDVVYVGEGELVRLLIKFSKPGGTHGRFMIHCHNLSHEDHDMMVQYQIGEHDADCDPINTCPPSSVWPPPPLGEPMPKPGQGTPTETTPAETTPTETTGGTGGTTPTTSEAPTTTSAPPTTSSSTTTSAPPTTSSSTTTSAPATTSATPTKTRRRGRR